MRDVDVDVDGGDVDDGGAGGAVAATISLVSSSTFQQTMVSLLATLFLGRYEIKETTLT